MSVPDRRTRATRQVGTGFAGSAAGGRSSAAGDGGGVGDGAASSVPVGLEPTTMDGRGDGAMTSETATSTTPTAMLQPAIARWRRRLARRTIRPYGGIR